MENAKYRWVNGATVKWVKNLKPYTSHLPDIQFVLYALIIYINKFMLQSTAGPLFLEMKLLSALNMKLHQCLTYEMLWSRYLFQLFERHQVLGRLMGNGGEKFKFILFSLILTSNLWRFTDGCHNWLIDYEVLDSGFLCPWVCLTYQKKGYVSVKVKISWDTGGFHKMFTIYIYGRRDLVDIDLF